MPLKKHIWWADFKNHYTEWLTWFAIVSPVGIKQVNDDGIKNGKLQNSSKLTKPLYFTDYITFDDPIDDNEFDIVYFQNSNQILRGRMMRGSSSLNYASNHRFGNQWNNLNQYNSLQFRLTHLTNGVCTELWKIQWTCAAEYVILCPNYSLSVHIVVCHVA